jgi:hypothetical protein
VDRRREEMDDCGCVQSTLDAVAAVFDPVLAALAPAVPVDVPGFVAADLEAVETFFCSYFPLASRSGPSSYTHS